MRRSRGLAAMAVLVVSVGMALPAGACGLDGVPSVSINGALAHLNGTRPSRLNLAHWAMFVFPALYRTGHSYRFSEDQRELHRSLLPQAWGRPWRWRFGDGVTSEGYAVTHRYRRPGAYKITVFAYYSSYRTWIEFDSVLITVR